MDTDLKSSTVPAEKKIEIVREALLKELDNFHHNSKLNRAFFIKNAIVDEIQEFSDYYNNQILNGFKALVEETEQAVQGKNEGKIQFRVVKELQKPTNIYDSEKDLGAYHTNDQGVDENLDFITISSSKNSIEKEQTMELLTIKDIETKIKEWMQFHASEKEELFKLKEDLKESKEGLAQINYVIDLLNNKLEEPKDEFININGTKINEVLEGLKKIKKLSSLDVYQKRFNEIAGSPFNSTEGGYVKVFNLLNLETAGDKYSNPENIKEVFAKWEKVNDHKGLESENYCVDQSFVYLSTKEGGKIPNAYYQLAYNKKAKNVLEKELGYDK